MSPLYCMLFERGPTAIAALVFGLAALATILISKLRSSRSYWSSQALAALALASGLLGHILGRREVSRTLQSLEDGTWKGEGFELHVFLGLVRDGVVDDPLYVGLVCCLVPLVLSSVICWRRLK